MLHPSSRDLPCTLCPPHFVPSNGAALLELLLTWMARVRQRRHLGTLDDRLLRDVGISRCEAWAEQQKPFWCP